VVGASILVGVLVLFGASKGAGAVPPPTECVLSLETLTAPGCKTLASDMGADPDPLPLWRSIECANVSRQERPTGAGDPHPTASGTAQGNDAYRRLTVLDGDD